MVTRVKTAEELKTALDKKKKKIVIEGDLVKKVKYLSYVKKSKKLELNTGMSTLFAGEALASFTGIAIPVAITLIVTFGVVGIVAMLCDYKMIIKDGENQIILERN
jgi:hypothetical protein